MPEYVMPIDTHHALVAAAYRARGFDEREADLAAHYCMLASWHGNHTHAALKALHLDDLFGSQAPHRGCVPGARIEKRDSPFAAAEQWNANHKLGQAVAAEAIETCMKLADQFGVGMVSVDNAFHYLWGGGYVLEAAKKGYIAYTNCTAALAEVVPFGGRFPTLGTNPHSWGLPTTEAVGFPVVIDWATSTVAMGKVQSLAREGKPLPPGAAVDENGNETTDPDKVAALLPFGAHKGYGLSLINELLAALIGGSLPTIRNRPELGEEGEKQAACFFFQVIHPDAVSAGAFAKGRDQAGNVKAVIDDLLGHGNSAPEGRAILPGQLEHAAAERSKQAGGLIFSEAEIAEFDKLARDHDVEFDTKKLERIQ